MSLKEAEFVVGETAKRINPNAHIIWGARVNEKIKKSSMRVLVVLGGVRFHKNKEMVRTEDLDLDIIG